MASSFEYLEHVLDLLADVPEVGARKMMGESSARHALPLARMQARFRPR